MRKEQARGDRRAIAYLICFVFGISLFAGAVHRSGDPALLRFVPPFVAGADLNHNDHLGAEYYNIARAIVEGRGFSDPFASGAGATAWMPPVYCYFLALLIAVFRTQALVALVVVFLKNCVLVGTGYLLFRSGRRPDSPVPSWTRLALFSVWLLTFFRWFFQITHDTWLIMALVGVHYVLAVRRWKAPGDALAQLGWGALGGITLLTQPVLGLTWGVLWSIVTLRHRRYRVAALALIPFLLIGGSWIVRNYVVFDRFILIKSNAYYDLYQANVEDADGVISEHSFANHPANQSEDYTARGEAAFLEDFRVRALGHLRERPSDYLKRVGNRLLAASLLYTPYFRWFEGHLLVIKRLVYPLPYFGLLIVLLLSGFKLRPEALIALVIYACFLAPYVLVSFYIRYSIPLVPLQLLFCAWALEGIGERFFGRARIE